MRTDHDRAVRWRQLVDLLARAGSLEGSAHAAAALDLIRSDARKIDLQLRAATARAIAALPIPFELLALFASDSLKVSAPVLAAARLEPGQWRAILSTADSKTGQFVRALHRTLDTASSAQFSAAPDPEPEPEHGAAIPTIEDAISRIEALRASREKRDAAPSPAPQQRTPQLEPAEPASDTSSNLFRWECGPSGELEWVDGGPRAALIGRPLIEPGHDRESGSREIARAFAVRAPFSNALISIGEETALAGEWQLSGMPAFDRLSGRFAGYRGVAKRTRAAPPATSAGAPRHPDTLRELVHEIKTPLNAIMGFAEIIQGQMFGPAGHTYRTRASEIVAQSHLLLAAIDDLDLAAKLQAGTYDAEIETDLARVLEQVAPRLEEKAAAANVELRLLVQPHLAPCAVSGPVVERLVQRLAGALIDCSEPAEQLQLTASQSNECCTVSMGRPRALNEIPEEDLLNPAFAVPRQRNSRLSLGFSLRLVRGIAQLAGGDLLVGRSKLTLRLARGDLRPPASRGYRQSTGQGL